MQQSWQPSASWTVGPAGGHTAIVRPAAGFAGLAVSEFRGQTPGGGAAERLFALLQTLKEQLSFDLLVDITCVDYLDYPAPAIASAWSICWPTP